MINTIISFHPALYVKFDFIFNLLLNKKLNNIPKITVIIHPIAFHQNQKILGTNNHK